MSPSNIDAWLHVIQDEHRQTFLFIETKRQREAIPRGQWLALRGLARLPGTRVLLVRGTPAQPEAWAWLHADDDAPADLYWYDEGGAVEAVQIGIQEAVNLWLEESRP
jgi:hypothetical protein